MTTKRSEMFETVFVLGLLGFGAYWLFFRTKEETPVYRPQPVEVVTTNSIASNVVDTNMSDSVAQLDPLAVAAPPHHNYEFEEDGFYGYFSAVNDEERAKGQATGRVSRFAFRGVVNGRYEITSVGNSGQGQLEYDCAQPCVVIHLVSNGSVIDRIQYNPGSVIGAAFQDAMRGELRIKPRRTATRSRSAPVIAVSRRSAPPVTQQDGPPSEGMGGIGPDPHN